MKNDSPGIIIELRPFAERDLIGSVFTQDLGILRGIFKAGAVAKHKPLVGQYGIASWNARLESQLGAIHFENEKNLILPFFSDTQQLKFINSCFELLSSFLPERESYKKLYIDTLQLLLNPGQNYMAWELSLLSELGYGLALDKCGNCGNRENIKYISPRTGRAICADCGKDYEQQLFKFPANLEATKFFLEQIHNLPQARKLIS